MFNPGDLVLAGYEYKDSYGTYFSVGIVVDRLITEYRNNKYTYYSVLINNEIKTWREGELEKLEEL